MKHFPCTVQKECPICVEPIHRKNLGTIRPCCRKLVCNNCVVSHVRSILTEGITGGGGRMVLNCPLGCGAELTDGEVRGFIHAQHYNFVAALLGRCLFIIVSTFSGLFINDGGVGRSRDSAMIRRRRSRRSRYDWWMLLTKSSAERRELRLYERWSLAVGLSQLERVSSSGGKGDATELYTHVVRCPQPDCECFWLANLAYRKQKLANERKFSKKKSRNATESTESTSITYRVARSLIKSASTWLFYAPIKPEVEESIMNKNKFTTAHWSEAEYLDMFNLQRNETSMNRQRHRDGGNMDGRRVTCPKCLLSFCGLCSRPWSTYSRSSGKRVFHSNKLCSAYSKQTTSRDNDDYAMAADAVDARSCPGCSMRTSRIQGCNHMVCLCGVEWCYVCECRWSFRHYSCTDRTASNDSAVGNDAGCVIS